MNNSKGSNYKRFSDNYFDRNHDDFCKTITKLYQTENHSMQLVNRLFDEGHKIIIMTARGRGSGIDWTGLTREQLERWGVKYHELEPMFHKPTADLFVDDKGINVFLHFYSDLIYYRLPLMN